MAWPTLNMISRVPLAALFGRTLDIGSRLPEACRLVTAMPAGGPPVIA